MGSVSLTLLNGLPGTTVDATDRGFQFGDGVFTTLRVLDGIPLFFQEHLARLARDAAVLRLPPPDPEILHREVAQLAKGCASGILKIQWTRGIGGRGYLPPETPEPTRFLILRSVPFVDEGLPAPWHLRMANLRLGINPALAGAKHMNRLEQILARLEWSDPAIDEALLLDAEGYVIEGTSTNLFLVLNDSLVTPLLDRAGVRGVMRDVLMDAALRQGVPVRQERILPEMLFEASELLMTNSVRGVCPVASLEEHRYTRQDFAQRAHAWYDEALTTTRKAWA